MCVYNSQMVCIMVYLRYYYILLLLLIGNNNRHRAKLASSNSIHTKALHCSYWDHLHTAPSVVFAVVPAWHKSIIAYYGPLLTALET